MKRTAHSTSMHKKIDESVSEIKKVDFSNKGKEEFTIKLNQVTNEISFYVNGVLRNKIKLIDAEKEFDEMLQIAKARILQLRSKQPN